MGTLRRRRYRALLGCIALLTCSTAGAQVIDLPDVDVTASRLGARVPRTPARERTPRSPDHDRAGDDAGDHAGDDGAGGSRHRHGGVRHRHRHDHHRRLLDGDHLDRYRALARPFAAGPPVARAGRSGHQPVRRRQRRPLAGRHARLRRRRGLEHASAHQRPAGHRSRPGGVRHRIDPARVHRARRDHPRQQRRGALWRRSGGRRDQHRDQDRRCLADQSAARHHRRLVQLPRGQCVVHRLEGPLVGEHLQQRDQLRRLSRAQLLPPAQRRRRFPLYGPGRQRLPQSVGRQFVARPAGRAAGRPVDQRQPARHRPAGSDHPVRLGRQERQKRHRLASPT